MGELVGDPPPLRSAPSCVGDSGVVRALEEQDDVYQLDWLDESPAPRSSASEPAKGRGPAQRYLGTAIVLVVAVTALAASIGWVTEGGRGDQDRPDASPATTEVTPDSSADAAVDTAGTPIDLAAALAGLSEYALDRVYLVTAVDEEGADIYVSLSSVAGLEGGFRFAYIGADGNPIIIDTATGRIRSVTREEPALDTDGLALVPDGDGMIGFHPDRLDTARRVSDHGRVVADADGTLTIIVDDGTRSAGAFTLGETAAGSPIPSSSQLAAIPGVGVFVSPQSGGTYEVSGDEFAQLTVWGMRSVVRDHHLERRQLDGVTLDVVVDHSTGEETTLRSDLVELNGDVLLSPDGRWVFVADSGEGASAFYDTETHTTVVFQPRAGRRSAVWAPDSSFMASLDPGAGRIWIEYTDGRSGAIALDLLGIRGLDSTELTIF